MAGFERLLSQGLEAGYADGTQREVVQRGSFQMETSQYISPTGGIYRDEWIADRTGGGQEIVQSGEVRYTRLYAGGTTRIDELSALGLTKKDVTRYLKKKIKGLGEKTRLSTNCNPEPDGDWQYTYTLREQIDNIPLTVGMETITFKGTLVFAHAFLHTPVE